MPRKIAIVFYSMYNHVYKLAVAAKRGVDSVPGCEAVLLRVRETLPPEVIEKINPPPPLDDSVPILEPMTLSQYDGFLFGQPTRYGMMPAQMKAMWDSTGSLWVRGALVGKPAGLFVSTSTQGGGQETTALTAISQLAHLGLIFVPPGYTAGDRMFDTDTVRGGSAYGYGTFSGADNSREPTELELDMMEHQGRYFAKVVKKLAREDVEDE